MPDVKTSRGDENDPHPRGMRGTSMRRPGRSASLTISSHRPVRAVCRLPGKEPDDFSGYVTQASSATISQPSSASSRYTIVPPA